MEKLPENRPEKKEERERIALENIGGPTIWCFGTVEAKTARGAFSCELETPSTMPWSNVVVRAWAFTAADGVMGVRALAGGTSGGGVKTCGRVANTSDNRDVTKNSP